MLFIYYLLFVLFPDVLVYRLFDRSCKKVSPDYWFNRYYLTGAIGGCWSWERLRESGHRCKWVAITERGRERERDRERGEDWSRETASARLLHITLNVDCLSDRKHCCELSVSLFERRLHARKTV